jgi:transcriptional regulator with XRE-family HTH domain
MKPTKRSLVINASRLRELRMDRGWSQVELGRRAGYSERLIRKAESGGSLNCDTVEDLAAAMSQEGCAVSIASITLDEIAIAQEFVRAYDALGQGLLAVCEGFFTERVHLHCPVDAGRFPFGGTWSGVGGLQKFFALLLHTFARRSNTLRPDFFSGDQGVIARFTDTLIFQGKNQAPVRFTLHFGFEEGLISRIDFEWARSLED